MKKPKAKGDEEKEERNDDVILGSLRNAGDMPSLLLTLLFLSRVDGIVIIETEEPNSSHDHLLSFSFTSHSSSPMAASPEALPGRPPDFRAPPPSPVANAGSRRSGVVNDDELTEFLEQSTRVPDLVLPDLLFPRQISIQSMPQIDFRSLMSVDDDNSIDISNVIESAAAIGCFQIVNHGISQDSVGSVLVAATEIFRLSPENKAIASRSSGKLYGFEEFSGDEDASDGGDACEEFVWFRDDGLTSVMEGIWPNGYSNFSQRMEILSKAIEEVAIRVLQVLSGSNLRNSTNGIESVKGLHENVGSICCLYKHCRNINAANKWLSSLKSDILRMLIKGSDYSHALCVHLCDGASDFHVYSKKGWMSFCPEKDAIIVTIGDQLQAWSGGRYRNVIGRPIFKVEEESISLSFLISPATVGQTSQRNTEKTISVGQQAIFAIIFTLLGHLFIHIYQKF
ncbi:protein DMR6-LIKE OXYGENASE 1 [Macadamia integrifolia]|uniref:protein DMR6-LIKE OXYGENASE 1 n=1 Tax=Macadamia integrifolia TaxID=60698 RepID=UPI001C4EA297|nr:protein DMR6-LIKE OXYGENASE 1 [Macadamia integrifolia]